MCCRGLDIRVTQIVQADMLQPRTLEDLLMKFHNAVGVIHFAGDGRGEQVRAVRVLFVFRREEVDHLLRDGDPADGGLRLGAGDLHAAALDADRLITDLDGLCLDVEIVPQQGGQLALAESRAELQI